MIEHTDKVRVYCADSTSGKVNAVQWTTSYIDAIVQLTENGCFNMGVGIWMDPEDDCAVYVVVPEGVWE